MEAHQTKIACSPGEHERRISLRLPIGDMSTSLWDRDGMMGRILDVSASGLRIATNAQLYAGDRRLLSFSDTDVFAASDPIWAEVIWCKAGCAGLRFYDSLAGVRTFRHVFRRWCGGGDPDTIPRGRGE